MALFIHRRFIPAPVRQGGTVPPRRADELRPHSQAPERLAREARFEAGTYEPASATKVSASLAHILPPVRSLSPTFLLVGSDNATRSEVPGADSRAPSVMTCAHCSNALWRVLTDVATSVNHPREVPPPLGHRCGVWLQLRRARLALQLHEEEAGGHRDRVRGCGGPTPRVIGRNGSRLHPPRTLDAGASSRPRRRTTSRPCRSSTSPRTTSFSTSTTRTARTARSRETSPSGRPRVGSSCEAHRKHHSA